MELSTPSISSDLQSLLSDTVKKALRALDYENGPGHSEVMLSDTGEIGMIESAGRGGGFMVFQGLVPWASGFDITKACIKQALGEYTTFENMRSSAVVLRFFPSRAGTITRIEGFDQIRNLGSHIQAEPFVRIGETISDAQSDGDRLGYLLTRADSVEEAQRLANLAESIIHFEIQ